MMIEMIIDMISIMIIDRCTNSIYITYTSPPKCAKTTVTIVTIVTASPLVLNFSLHQTSTFLLPLIVAIAPSLGKNIFLGSAQFFLGYVGKQQELWALKLFNTMYQS